MPENSDFDIESHVELTVIMPCLNEAETLGSCIRKAQSFFVRTGTIGEIVVGDNGSTDGSIRIAEELGARVVNVPVRGYGAAIQGAIAAARGKFCIMGDSDASYDFAQLDSFLEALRSGADVVMGNRFRGRIEVGAMPWKNRYIGNPVLTWIGKTLFNSEIGDFHCGLRGFSKQAIQALDLRTTGMEFASEMVIKATLLKLNVAEVPTTLSKDGRSRPPHLRPFRDGWRHLRFMALFSPNWLFLYPGLALTVGSLFVGGALAIRPIEIAGVRFGIDTMIYCATLCEIGFQAILFALLSRTFAIQEGLFPKPSQQSLFDRTFTLEKGVIIGACLVFIGIYLLLYSFKTWSNAKFGNIDVETFTKFVILSSLSLSIGSETILSSVLMSILKLNIRH